jgi:aminoglycoside phosphotransferase (APT) family kinase protein
VTGGAVNIENHAALLEYLRRARRIDVQESPDFQSLSGGVSNRTVLVRRGGGDHTDWVVKQALPKLRTDADWFSDPSRSHREALAIKWLAKLAPPRSIPPLVFEDESQHLLAMEAVPQPHENWKTMLMSGRVCQEHVEQFGKLLGSIHRRAAESSQPLRELFDDRSFFESLRLEPYYLYAARQVPEAAEFLDALVTDTRSRRITLVHGDYSPKNVLVFDGRLVLLDHEVIHWGDPSFDLGFALTHLFSKGHHLSALRDRFIAAIRTFRDSYAATVGAAYWNADLEAMCVRHTLGCLLARVAGRSPLEYLDPNELARQRSSVLELMRTPPASIEDLLDGFFSHLKSNDKN